jgi:hypothetical protein
MDEQQREELRQLAEKLAVVRNDLGYLGDSIRNAAVAALPLVRRVTDSIVDGTRKSVERFEAMTEEERKQLPPNMVKILESMRQAFRASDEADKKKLGNQ